MILRQYGQYSGDFPIRSATKAGYMTMIKIATFILFLFCLASCRSEPDSLDLKDFYYPYKSLEGGLVYEYRPVGNDSLPTDHWFLKSVQDDKGWHLTGNFYDNQLTIKQFYIEDIVASGAVMREYFLYNYDSLGNTSRFDAEITAGNSFPFTLKDSTSILLFDLSWTFSETPLNKTRLIRNRQYDSKSNYKFNGEQKPAVVFNVKELVDNETEGHIESQYNGREIYVKDIGLVFYEKEISPGFNLSYLLHSIYPMEELEKKYLKINEVE